MTVTGLHHAGVHVASFERPIIFLPGGVRVALGRAAEYGGRQLASLEVGRSRVKLIAGGAPRATGVVDHLAFEGHDPDDWVPRLWDRGSGWGYRRLLLRDAGGPNRRSRRDRCSLVAWPAMQPGACRHLAIPRERSGQAKG